METILEREADGMKQEAEGACEEGTPYPESCYSWRRSSSAVRHAHSFSPALSSVSSQFLERPR